MGKCRKIITCSELAEAVSAGALARPHASAGMRYHTLDELEALFRTLQIEFGRLGP
jgi:hypothetical protein